MAADRGREKKGQLSGHGSMVFNSGPKGTAIGEVFVMATIPEYESDGGEGPELTTGQPAVVSAPAVELPAALVVHKKPRKLDQIKNMLEALVEQILGRRATVRVFTAVKAREAIDIIKNITYHELRLIIIFGKKYALKIVKEIHQHKLIQDKLIISCVDFKDPAQSESAKKAAAELIALGVNEVIALQDFDAALQKLQEQLTPKLATLWSQTPALPPATQTGVYATQTQRVVIQPQIIQPATPITFRPYVREDVLLLLNYYHKHNEKDKNPQ